MTDRIRWEAGQFGNLVGYAGTVESWVFQVWHISDDEDSHWSLISSLPDAQNWNAADPDDPEPLKAEAERWLTEFVSSLGAVFPDPELPECARCEEPVTGTPVTDPDDLMGREFCREECRDASAEASFEQRYQPGVAT